MRYTFYTFIMVFCLTACGESEEKREDSVLEKTAKSTMSKAEKAAAKANKVIEEQQKVLDAQ